MSVIESRDNRDVFVGGPLHCSENFKCFGFVVGMKNVEVAK